MLFRKKIVHSCCYCQNSTKLNNNTILCTKQGLVPADKPCRKFSYDPCKRIPPKEKAADFSVYGQEDFSL